MYELFFIIMFLILIWVLKYVWNWIGGRGVVIEGLNTINNRMAVDDQYSHDRLFDNTIYFANSYAMNDGDMDITYNLSRGIDRCRLVCPGRCVEYGVSGNATCFMDDDKKKS